MAPPKVLGALVIWSLLGNPARAADVAPAADARLPTASATTTPIRPTSLDADEWTVTAAAGPVIATLASPVRGPVATFLRLEEHRLAGRVAAPVEP